MTGKDCRIKSGNDSGIESGNDNGIKAGNDSDIKPGNDNGIKAGNDSGIEAGMTLLPNSPMHTDREDSILRHESSLSQDSVCWGTACYGHLPYCSSVCISARNG